jgi:hypothetical protein
VQDDSVKMERQKMLNARIGNYVLHVLGKPPKLLTVQVRPLGGGNYRVNVRIGDAAACAKIPHSYFVRADGNGTILAATPTLRRHYEPIQEK